MLHLMIFLIKIVKVLKLRLF